MAYLVLALFLLECFKLHVTLQGLAGQALEEAVAGGLLQLSKPQWAVDSSHYSPASAPAVE